MSATLTADSYIQSLATSTSFTPTSFTPTSFTPTPSSTSTSSNIPRRMPGLPKNINTTSLLRARYFYMARSLASPIRSIPNSKLNLIRKLAWLLVLFQLLDGFFTIVGIRYFGTEIEGNPLIKQIVEICGADFGISFVKLSTIIIIFSICIVGSRVSWLTKALRGVAGIYFVFALVPWTLLFSSYYLGY